MDTNTITPESTQRDFPLLSVKTSRASRVAELTRQMMNRGCLAVVVGSGPIKPVSYIDIMLDAVSVIGAGNDFASITFATKQGDTYKLEGTVQLYKIDEAKTS